MFTLNSVDLSGLNSMQQGIQAALIGVGEDGDARELTRQTAKLLAWDCSRVLGPRTAEVGKKKILKDVKGVFAVMPTHPFSDENAGGNNGVRWLYAGPNYLVGAKNEDYFPDAGDSAVNAIYRQQGHGKSTRGAAWSAVGNRGKQHVLLRNRIILKRQRFKALVDRLQARVGRLKATFAYTANRLGYNKVPAWVSRHFEAVAKDGKAVFDDSALKHPTHPSILFGSRAPGIANFGELIQKAVDIRTRKMRERLRLILNDYAHDQHAKHGIRRHAKAHQEEEE